MLHCALGVLYAGLDHHLQESETIIKYCSEISLHASETFLKQDYSDHVQWRRTLLIYPHLIKSTWCKCWQLKSFSRDNDAVHLLGMTNGQFRPFLLLFVAGRGVIGSEASWGQINESSVGKRTTVVLSWEEQSHCQHLSLGNRSLKLHRHIFDSRTNILIRCQFILIKVVRFDWQARWRPEIS